MDSRLDVLAQVRSNVSRDLPEWLRAVLKLMYAALMRAGQRCCQSQRGLC